MFSRWGSQSRATQCRLTRLRSLVSALLKSKTSNAGFARSRRSSGKSIASQFAGFDKTKDRPDLLALDADGKLVVIEIKRDRLGNGAVSRSHTEAPAVEEGQASQVTLPSLPHLAQAATARC